MSLRRRRSSAQSVDATIHLSVNNAPLRIDCFRGNSSLKAEFAACGRTQCGRSQILSPGCIFPFGCVPADQYSTIDGLQFLALIEGMGSPISGVPLRSDRRHGSLTVL